jgi:Flp pilus assembly protein TadD
MKTLCRSICFGRTATAVALALCALSSAWADESPKSFADMVAKLALVPAGNHDSEMLAKVTVAVEAIKRQELPKAHQAVNEALQLDPRNSQLHFLNGFVYHLQARLGDTQKGEMALEGYQQALRIDPSNWIAQEFQGLAYMDLKQFDRARLAFSEALLLTPESTVSVYGLMVASYLTGDAKTACAMADQFQKASAESPRGFVVSSISVYASCANFTQAERMRDALSRLGGAATEVERADRRLAQWKSFYRRQEQAQAAAGDKAPAAAGLVQTAFAVGPAPAPSSTRPELLAQAFAIPTPAARPVPAPAAASPAAATATATPSSPSVDTTVSGPRMLLVDVVLLSTQEILSTSKGVNLLSALTLQLGGGNVAAYSRVITSNATGDAAATVGTAITRALTIPALSYSLNIVNANSSLNEVLARPTLAAIEGMPSEFFSGTNLSAGLVSTSTQGGTTIVPLDKKFGIKLGVTPTFLPQGRVQLLVQAQRTSLNASSESSRVAYQIEIGETTANANVVMNLGETLVLSGLSEKSSSTTRDGVPGLQDVPGIQYLFSKKTTNNIQRSVLILVTPRAPIQIAESAQGAGDTLASRMQALRERFGIATSIPANVEAIMTQFQGDEYFREFRQGDVSMERWDRMRSTGDRLKEALGFLYF